MLTWRERRATAGTWWWSWPASAEARWQAVAATADGTKVANEQDAMADPEAFMNEAWPKALALLKELCESGG